MKRKHRLQHELLENRQLLAVNCVPLPTPAEAPPLSAPVERVTASPVPDVTVRDTPDSARSIADIQLGWSSRAATHAPDFVHEQGNQLFVLDQDGSGRVGLLTIFDRGDDGSLEVVEEIEVDFRVDEMIVTDDQIVLLGVEPDWRIASSDGADSTDGVIPFAPEPLPLGLTRVVTVNLGEAIGVVQQRFEVALNVMDRDGSRLLMRLTPHPFFVPAIGLHPPVYLPPRGDASLHVFEIRANGIHETASVQYVPQGPAQLVGDSVIVAGLRNYPIVSTAETDVPLEDGSWSGEPNQPLTPQLGPIAFPNSVIRQYRIDGQSMQPVAEFDLGPGSVTELRVSQDATTVTVVQFVIELDEAGQQVSRVRHETELFDFSDGELHPFETVPIPGFPLATYDDFVLLTDHHETLYVVDTNQALDVTADGRVQRIALPAGFRVDSSVFRGTYDRVVLMLERVVSGSDQLGIGDGLGPQWERYESLLLTVSMRDATIIGDARLDDGVRFTWPRGLTAIDAANDRFGFFVNLQPEAEQRGLQFRFGRLSEGGEFVTEGSIAVGNWLEVDANAQRLIARQPDRLVEYRWDDVDNPLITPIGSPTPPIEILVELGLRAVDDRGEPLTELTTGQDFWIEFTAKDLRDFGHGVFAAFFDLAVPGEHIVLSGPVEYGDGFQSINHGELGHAFVDDLGAIGNRVESQGNGVQRILRIAARAVASGEFTLTPEAADAEGTETLLRGRDTIVPDHSVRFSPLTLAIVDPPQENPLDADGNGIVSARDALVIINFLHRFGTTPVAELEERIATVRGERETVTGDEMAVMRRYDTNANGTITTLDALVVINRMSRERLNRDRTESVFAAIGAGLDNDDDDQMIMIE